MSIWPLKKKQGKVDLDKTLGKDLNENLEILLQDCRQNLHSVDEELITKAFRWVVDAHKNKVRKSGEPHYTHPLSVARIVVNELPLDNISVVSALLHDIIYPGSSYTIKDIRSEFGSTVAEIVDSVTKIQSIEMHEIASIENYRKLLLSLFKDVRIILIKLADRLHNMRTLDFLPIDQQNRIARETLEIYAPFANRFGLGNIKWELEDLSFKFLNRKEYKEIRDALQLTRKEREEYIRNFTKPIRERLEKDEIFKKNNIKFEIIGRAKHIYSIYNKMLAREKSIDELYDLFAIRIILDTEDNYYCYFVYGVITEIYKQIPGSFKNYISNPKVNGYRSIHTAVIGPEERMVEIQIRTRQMHLIAEKGFAAHFKYKRGLLPAQSVLEDKNLEQWMDMVRSIFENVSDTPPEQLLENVKRNLLIDEIYIFTPSNEFRILPKDATPLDYAYSIHSDIGNHCIGAKVNGRIVPLDYKLNTGDQIEILTSKNQKPAREWLGIVITQKAQSYIQKYFKEEKKEFIRKGRDSWEKLLVEYDIKLNDFEIDALVSYLGFNSRNDLYHAYGSNIIAKDEILVLINNKTFSGKIYTDNNNIHAGSEGNGGLKTLESTRTRQEIATANLDSSIPVSYSPCCNPLPGDSIIGVITPGHDIKIHRRICRKISHLIAAKDPSLFELDWRALPKDIFSSRITIFGEDKPTILNEITSLILSLDNISIKGFNFDTLDSGVKGFITINIQNLEALNGVVEKIRTIAGIKLVERSIE